MSKKLMLVFAHPDDESFGAGGTVARYSSQGAEITLVCATRGEAGKWGRITPEPGQSLGEVREKELLAAAKVLGIGEVIFLDYVDKTLSDIPLAGAAAKIAGIMEEKQPDAVITFGADGVSGHPDHKAIHRMATDAFHLYLEFVQGKNGGGEENKALKNDNSPALYYLCFPPEAPVLRGIAPRPAAVKPNIAIDAAGYWLLKKEAIECHKTQAFSKERLFAAGEEKIRQLFQKEYYLRAYPPGTPLDPGDFFR